MIAFRVKQWAAWAPGLDNQAAWQAWLADPLFNFPDNSPVLSEMPAMLRRRAGRRQSGAANGLLGDGK